MTIPICFTSFGLADARREGSRLLHPRLLARGSSLEPGADVFGLVHRGLSDLHVFPVRRICVLET